jgi:creatinine amidohydrolase
MGTYNWADLTREEISRLATRAVAVLPVASIEQHGPHLATITDTALINEIIARACSVVANHVDVLLAPTLPYGCSDYHFPFGGTLSLTSRTFQAVLADLLRSLAKAGCARTFVLNGHGGNAEICRVVAADAAREENMTVVTASYWDLIEPPDDADFPGHAGKFETSLMLAAHPQLVHLDRARPSPLSLPPQLRGLQITPPDLWQRIDGFTDDPRCARSETGENLLQRCAEAVARAIRGVAAL